MRRQHRALRILWLVSLVDAALLVAVLAIERLRPEHSFPNSLLVYLPQWLWLIVPGLLGLIGASVRRWRLMGLNALVLVLALPTLSGFQLATGSPGEGSTGGQRVRILTWNIHNEYRRVEEIRARIAAMRPDVVCLQEAHDGRFDDLFPTWWTRFERGGVATYSRRPMVAAETVGRSGFDFRPWTACEIETPSGSIAVLNVHLTGGKTMVRLRHENRHAIDVLDHCVRVRAEEFETILSAIPPSMPTVVAGDFNTPPNSSFHRELAARMTDSFAATRFGFGLTFLLDKRLPAWRIDYIWCGEGVRPVRCWVGEARPSDHRPVLAEVVVR